MVPYLDVIIIDSIIIVIFTIIYSSPPIFIIIGAKLPKFAIGGVFGVVGRVVGVV